MRRGKRRSNKRVPAVVAAAIVAAAVLAAGVIFFDHPRSGSATESTATAPTPATLARSTPSSTSTSVPQPPPTDAQILIVGDSLTGQAKAPIAQLLSDLDADIRFENRTTVAHWSFYLPGLIERDPPDVLVVALGTNDNLAYDEPPGADLTGRATTYTERVEALLETTDEIPCRVWIEPSEFGHRVRYRENARSLNAALEMTLNHHGVRFVSWTDRMASGHAYENEWMHGDGIHLTDKGQSVYGALVAQAARNGCP